MSNLRPIPQRRAQPGEIVATADGKEYIVQYVTLKTAKLTGVIDGLTHTLPPGAIYPKPNATAPKRQTPDEEFLD